MTDLLAYWPIIIALLGLAVAWGAALVKIVDLRDRVTALEQQADRRQAEIAAALEQLKLDVRELKTMLRLRAEAG